MPEKNAFGDTLKVGWAKVNITPAIGTPLAGYGKRRGMKYTSVHDSVWVRTFAFDNGLNQAYFVSLDMLIAPMSIVDALEQEYKRIGLQPDQVYLTATHTHTSFGGWGKKLAGKLMAGRYDKVLVRQTAQHIIQSIILANKDLQEAKVGYGITDGAALIKNRLTGSVIARDSTVRFMKFERNSGETAILSTFSAHPTILPSMQAILSGDYPNVLVRELEKEVNFAAFSAGAVGSHSSVYHNGDSFKSTEEIGSYLAKSILDTYVKTEAFYTTELKYYQASLYMPEPQWRLGEQKRFNARLFYTFFGKYKAYLKSLTIGETTLLGVPADFSGEFMSDLEIQAIQQNKNLILTGFNGGYLGYIIPDRHYHLKNYEARAMNFYGPTAGSYLSHLLALLLAK